MSKTHWKKLINPDYIGAYALPEGQDMTVVIKSVAREVVTSTGGKKEECTVCQLVNNKPLILNVTNGKMIAKLYGPYIEDWVGKPVTLYASTTKLAGEVVECIRIRPNVVQAAPKKGKITDDRLSAAIASIKAGEFTVEKVNERFELTIEQQAKLHSELEKVDDQNTSVVAE